MKKKENLKDPAVKDQVRERMKAFNKQLTWCSFSQVEVNSSTTSFVDEYRSPEQFMVNSVRGTEDTVTCIYRPDILNDEQRKKNI